MATIGGDLLEIRVKHPTLGEHVFYPKSNEGNIVDPGGFTAGDDANMISGDGQPIWQLNQKRGSIEAVVANDPNTRQDINFASALQGAIEDGNWTFSHISGVVWGFVGRPVGDLTVDINAATFTLKVAGGKPIKIAG